jgi:hypothetical protein
MRAARRSCWAAIMAHLSGQLSQCRPDGMKGVGFAFKPATQFSEKRRVR